MIHLVALICSDYARSRAFYACEPIRVDEYIDCRFTFFADPDGLPIELYEAGCVQ